MKSNQVIEEMEMFEYILAFNNERTLLSDNSAKKASENGRMFCMKESGKYLGFICTKYERQCASGIILEIITFAYTKEQYRNKGVFTSLVEHVFNTAEKSVELNILNNHPFYKTVDSCLKKMGLKNTETFHYFSLDTKKDLSIWKKIKKENHLEECCNWLKTNGYQLYNLSQVDDSVIEQLKNSRNSEFQNELNPAEFFEPSFDGEIVDDLSFVVLRENKLESYVISLKSNDNGIILQQLASSKETKNKGIIMLILTAYVDNYCKNKYSKITYGILPYNIPSISLKRIFEGYFDIAESAIINYYK